MARDVALEVTTPDGVVVESLSPFPFSAHGGRTIITLGALVAEQVVEIVLRLNFPYGEVGRESGAVLSLAARDAAVEGWRVRCVVVGVRRRQDQRLQPRDVEVDRAVARVFAARARQEATSLNRSGDFVGARSALGGRRQTHPAATPAAIRRCARWSASSSRVERRSQHQCPRPPASRCTSPPTRRPSPARQTARPSAATPNSRRRSETNGLGESAPEPARHTHYYCDAANSPSAAVGAGEPTPAKPQTARFQHFNSEIRPKPQLWTRIRSRSGDEPPVRARAKHSGYGTTTAGQCRGRRGPSRHGSGSQVGRCVARRTAERRSCRSVRQRKRPASRSRPGASSSANGTRASLSERGIGPPSPSVPPLMRISPRRAPPINRETRFTSRRRSSC